MLMIRQFALASLLLASPAFAAVDFAKQIMPLLDKHCVDCHSASDADGDFALDTLEGLLAGGKTGKAFAPGKAQDSLLVKFLEGRSGKTGKNQFMPPGKRDHLSAAEIALVRQWIDEGATAGASAPTDPLAKLPKIASQTKVKPIHAIAVSAKLIALGRFGSVELIDTATRQSVRTLSGITGKASALVFSADGASVFIAAGDAGVNGIAYQFNTADGKLLHQLTGHTDALYALALSPDGRQLATGGYDQKIKLWDVATGKEVRTIKGHNGGINALAYRPDGKVLASASSDRTVKLWDTATGNRLETFSQPLKEQLTLAFSADGHTLLAGGGDSRIRQWRISDKATEGSNPILETKFAHEGSILQLVMSPDGKSFASSASDRALKVWNSANVTPLKQFDPQSDWASAVAWIDSTHLVAARQDGTTAVYDVASGKTQPLLAAAKPAAASPNKKPAAKPELTRLFPRGFQSGVETLITATGKGLTGVKQIKTTDPRVVATKLEAKGTTLTLKVTSPTDLPRGSYEVSIVTAAGETTKLPLLADDLQQFTQPTTVDLAQRSADVWGTLMATGQRDEHRFQAKAGQTFVLDLAAKRVGSKAETIQLELLDASGKQLVINHGLDSGSDPFIAFQPKADGEFIARVSETTLEGSADHAYRLTITNHSYVTGWWPLTVPVNRDTKIRLVGHELHGASMTVHPTQPGKVVVPGISPSTRFREVPSVLATEMNEELEQEPNDEPAQAKPLTPPVSVNGRLLVAGQAEASDTDVYAFEAKAGDEWMIETTAAQSMAPTDTRLEVLNADGSPVERMRVQAIRSSWNNFRSVDADNQDIRLENYMETGLNEFVYFNGDIMKTFRLPRGPDGGFFFYTSNGKRRAYFDTTATAHPLDEPCYVVEPLKPNEAPLPNGLPVISIPFANDDDGLRKLGRDSRLHFTAPSNAKYLIRVTDSRGWSGERFAYRLIVRKPVPDFAVKLSGENMSVGAGSAMGFSLRAERLDDFEEPITVKIEGLPQGWIASSPIVIERGHTLASGSLYAEPTATAGDWSKVKIIATSGTHTHEVNGFGKVTLAAKPKFIANLEPAVNDQPVARSNSQPQVITLVPGQLANAFIRVERSGNDGILNFDVHGLPHGVIVDDIGLNGIQVREKENDREIRFACAKWVQPQERLIHAAVSSARNEADSANLATSFPVLLRVVAAK
jgi:WD40 repeat protein/mono/diheme cytochrome c family protein